MGVCGDVGWGGVGWVLISGSVWGCGVYSFPTVPRFSLVGCKNSTYKMSCPHGIDKRLGLTVYKIDTKCSVKEFFLYIYALLNSN